MSSSLLKKMEKFSLPDLESLMPEAEDYLKKYEKAINKVRGMDPFISSLFFVSENLHILIEKDAVQSFSQTYKTNTLITAHYPPAPPVFYNSSNISPKEAIWKADLEAFEKYGHHTHSKFEERNFRLLLPENVRNDKVKINEGFDENSLMEVFETIYSAGKEAKDRNRISDIKYAVRVTYNRSLYIDVLGNKILQEIPYWYILVTVESRAEDLPERKLSFDYSTGAVGGLRSFKKLEKMLREGILETAENVAKFAGAKSGIKGFSLKSGIYNVVLDAKVAGVSFHEFGAGHLAEAHRLLEEGESLPFSGKFGKKVSSSHITLIDDSRFQINGIKPISFYVYDAEGVKKRKVKIIEDGKFKSLLHSKLTAGTLSEEEGGGFLTGNARVEPENEEKMPIVPRMSTLYLEPGDYRLEELLEEAKGGLFIRSGAPSGAVITQLAVGMIPLDEIYFISQNLDLIPIRAPRTWVYLRETSESFLHKIEKVGGPSTMKMDTGFCGAESGFIPHTIYSPAIYVKNAHLLLTNVAKPLKPPLIEF